MVAASERGRYHVSHPQIEEPGIVNKSQIIKVVIAVILLITAIVIIVSSLSGGGESGKPGTIDTGVPGAPSSN